MAQTAISIPSDRRFGLTFACIFAVLTAYGVYRTWPGSSVITLGAAAAALAGIAIISPAALHPLNRVWFKLGVVLGRIVSPIVLGIMFFTLITPIGWFIRLFGRDELRLKKRQTASYWIDRQPPGPAGDSFKNMF